MTTAVMGSASDYPEFLAWHALLQPLFNIEPPDWTVKEPMERQLPGFGATFNATDDDDDVSDDEDTDDDEEDDG